ncbi:hypothetical protein [Alcanivorax sp. 24]|uniref:hypothetical protein n=1 Tax=Alcanivorax sp. 24 TaxID=2545266 RepID=UPI00105E05D1|nr:hypothetical protein [Alcanivorax sp. 24]
MWIRKRRKGKRLILHIGQPKSGTTSIQDFLAFERQRLARQNYLYPVLENVENRNAHHALSYSLRERVERGVRIKGHDASRQVDIWGRLSDQISADCCGTVVLSSEDFYFLDYGGRQHGSAIQELGKWADQHFDEVTVLAYLNRQDRHVESWCNEIVKHGIDQTTLPIAKIADRLPNCHSNYAGLRSRWMKVFGNGVQFRPFQRSALKDGDAVMDFCDVIGYEPSTAVRNFERKNLRVTRLAFEVLRNANRFEHNQEVHRVCVKALQEIAPEDSRDDLKVNPGLFFEEAMREKWRVSNAKYDIGFEDPELKQAVGDPVPYSLWQPEDLVPVEVKARHLMGSNERRVAAAGALLMAAVEVMRATE